MLEQLLLICTIITVTITAVVATLYFRNRNKKSILDLDSDILMERVRALEILLRRLLSRGSPVDLGAMADFERSLRLGSSVVFLGHSTEQIPSVHLSTIRNNLRRAPGAGEVDAVSRISYSFLVSISNHERDRLSMAAKLGSVTPEIFDPGPMEDMLYDSTRPIQRNARTNCSVLPLPGEWTKWPYVLYRSKQDDGTDKITVLRGTKRGGEISEKYVRLHSDDAEAFFNAIKLAMVVGNQAILDPQFWAWFKSPMEAAIDSTDAAMPEAPRSAFAGVDDDVIHVDFKAAGAQGSIDKSTKSEAESIRPIRNLSNRLGLARKRGEAPH